MGGKGSGRPIKHKTEEERRQAILESKRKYNKAHREERIAYMKRWRKSKEQTMDSLKVSIISMFVILLLPLIVVFSIGMFAWCCAKAVVAWLTFDF